MEMVPDTVRDTVRDYLELSKARLSALVLFATAVGFWMGLRAPSHWPQLLPVCAGTALVVAGANALNQWLERGWDAQMQRTRARPLPAGRLTPQAARRFGTAASILGLLLLGITGHWLAAALALVGWISYVLLYTPLKRVSPLCTLVGAVPGALPPVIGWAAAQHRLGLEAAALFLIMYVWQLPHFLALAVLYRDDYARAGFPMLPVVDRGDGLTARQLLWYGLALVPLSLFPAVVGMTGRAYFYGALLISGALLSVVVWAAWRRTAQSARTLFRASVLYLPVLLVWLACDRSALLADAVRPSAPPSAPIYGTLPPFALTSEARTTVTREALRGSVWIAAFLFTRCTGQCPMITARLGGLQRRFMQEPRLALIAISVDPAHDSPEILAAYARRAGADPRRWRFLTGDADAIQRLAQQGFHLSLVEGGSPQEPITHSVKLALVDQDGSVRGYYDATEEAAMARLEADATALLRR